jgi:hypothetical protein
MSNHKKKKEVYPRWYLGYRAFLDHILPDQYPEDLSKEELQEWLEGWSTSFQDYFETWSSKSREDI